MREFGFVRVTAATPRVVVGDPAANANNILNLIGRMPVSDVVVFPELSITGYTLGDLVQQQLLLDAAKEETEKLAQEIPDEFGIVIVGLPFQVGNALYNCAAVLSGGRVIGLIPKTHLPNYKEFYEARWYMNGTDNVPPIVKFHSYNVDFGKDLLYRIGKAVVGVEICEDLWVPIPPSTFQAMAGANIICNPSASNELVGKHSYRRSLITGQSGRLICGYIYAGAGPTESTSDLVMGGALIIAENGMIMKERRQVGTSQLYRESDSITVDLDVEKLMAERRSTSSYVSSQSDNSVRIIDVTECRHIWGGSDYADFEPQGLYREVDSSPFVPKNERELADRCAEIFNIQVAGLANRMEVANPETLNIGVSGGLDSTLALLVAVKACDTLGWDRKRVHGITMPGFGTTDKTKDNAWQLMLDLGITRDEIDICQLSFDAFKELNHKPFGIDCSPPDDLSWFKRQLAQISNGNRHDLVFENVQARLRTFLLMSKGFVLGTGDMSELALGWATYNGDHMSMYNVNCSIPKTLVKFLVQYVAKTEFAHTDTGSLLEAIADTVISPELLPVGPNGELQATEDVVGPYELHDFFLFNMVRNGFGPKKILFLAEHTKFNVDYGSEIMEKWLKVFYKRFFTQQFKRNCVPDGPKVGSVSLSPRGDWRMPSDASYYLWMKELEE